MKKLLLTLCLLAGSAQAKIGLSETNSNRAKAAVYSGLALRLAFVLADDTWNVIAASKSYYDGNLRLPNSDQLINKKVFFNLLSRTLEKIGIYFLATSFLATEALQSFRKSQLNKDNQHKEHHHETSH